MSNATLYVTLLHKQRCFDCTVSKIHGVSSWTSVDKKIQKKKIRSERILPSRKSELIGNTDTHIVTVIVAHLCAVTPTTSRTDSCSADRGKYRRPTARSLNEDERLSGNAARAGDVRASCYPGDRAPSTNHALVPISLRRHSSISRTTYIHMYRRETRGNRRINRDFWHKSEAPFTRVSSRGNDKVRSRDTSSSWRRPRYFSATSPPAERIRPRPRPRPHPALTHLTLLLVGSHFWFHLTIHSAAHNADNNKTQIKLCSAHCRSCSSLTDSLVSLSPSRLPRLPRLLLTSACSAPSLLTRCSCLTPDVRHVRLTHESLVQFTWEKILVRIRCVMFVLSLHFLLGSLSLLTSCNVSKQATENAR